MNEVKRRLIKTVAAVLITMMLYVLLLCVDMLLGINHKEWLSFSNMYTPFFSAIAAIYVISKYAKDSIKSAKRRSLGSVLGGVYGMILSLIIEYIFLDLVGFNINEIEGLIIWKIIQFSIVGISLMPLIIMTRKLKWDDALFITGLTYFSVTISIRNGGMPVIQFAFNRILSTIIGVGIALFVNHFYLLEHRNKDITFVCCFENKHIENDLSFNDEEIYLSNRLYECDMDLIFATSLTLGELGKILTEIDFYRPLIIMDGAASFDSRTKKFIYVDNMSKEITEELKNVLHKYIKNVFLYTVINDVMVCYYRSIINEGEQDYFRVCYENESFKFHYGDIPSHLDVCCMSVILEEDKVEEILNDPYIKDNKFISVVVNDYKVNGYKFINIYNKGVNKLKAFNSINMNKNNKLVVIGNKVNDIELMKETHDSSCYLDSDIEVKENANNIINSTLLKDGLMYIKKIYHSRKK